VKGNSLLTYSATVSAQSLRCICAQFSQSCAVCKLSSITQSELNRIVKTVPRDILFSKLSKYDLSGLDVSVLYDDNIFVALKNHVEPTSELELGLTKLLRGESIRTIDAIRYGFVRLGNKWVEADGFVIPIPQYDEYQPFWNQFASYQPILEPYLGYDYHEVSPGLYYWGDLPHREIGNPVVVVDMLDCTCSFQRDESTSSVLFSERPSDVPGWFHSSVTPSIDFAFGANVVGASVIVYYQRAAITDSTLEHLTWHLLKQCSGLPRSLTIQRYGRLFYAFPFLHDYLYRILDFSSDSIVFLTDRYFDS